MTICQISTIDGSAKLERQVTKITAQMKHQCPTVEAAGYFRLGRNMILKVSFSLLKIDLYLIYYISEQNLFKIFICMYQFLYSSQDIHLHTVQKQLLALLITLPRNELLCQLFWGLCSNGFHTNEGLVTMVDKKIKILGAVWQCCLAGSSKTAPRILIFFFKYHGCQTFILYEIHCYLSSQKS